MDTYWNIELFGGLCVSRSGERTTRFATQKTAGLLAYLAFYRKRTHLRETLVEILWPEVEPSQGRSRLSTLLSYLRNLLEPPGVSAGAMVLSDRTTVRLNADLISTDVAQWEAILARAAKSTETREQVALLEESRALYKGDLLPGYYESWVAQEQPALREKHTDSLHALALGLSKSGEYAAAAGVLDEAITADPYRESLVRLQMRCCAASGRAEAAADAYRRLAERLREDLSAQPAAMTRTLADKMQSDPGGFAPDEETFTVVGTRRRNGPDSAAAPATHPAAPSTPTSAGPSAATPAVPSVATSAAPATHLTDPSTPTDAGPSAATSAGPSAAAAAHSGDRHAPPTSTLPGDGHAPPGPPPNVGREAAGPMLTSPSTALSDAPRHGVRPPLSLPLQLGRFVGRAAEIDRILGWMAAGERLITLTGAGGTGKTRLAIETAARAAERFAGRVWFADLTRTADPRLLGFELAHALSLPPTQNGDALDQAVERLNEAPSLLVLDNFEHLLRNGGQVGKSDRPAMAGGVGFARLLLERAPQLSLLVTSRQPLHLGGEQEYSVPVLSIPEDESTPERLIEVESVALYVDRARAVRPDFALTSNNCLTVAALCRKLDGMPLAIEMAAAWAKTITPARMLERLEKQYSSLANRRRDVPERHRSLRAAIEWSYDLLAPEEQALLARLSVFHGGCAADDAEAVCRASDAVAGLAELQERSLIVGEERDGDIRFRILEPIRAFAAEQLAERGEADEIRGRHFAHFLALVDDAKDKLFGPESVRWVQRLLPEQDNVRYALDHAPDPVDRLRMITWFFRFWYERGNYVEAHHRLKQAIESAPDAPPEDRAHALNGIGMLCNLQGMFRDAESYFLEGLKLWEGLGNGKYAAKVRNNLGAMYYRQGDLERSREEFEHSLRHQQELGERFACAVVLYNLGCVACEQGDIPSAVRYHRESLEMKREMGDAHGVAAGLAGLGNVALIQGDYARARALLSESVTAHREIEIENGAVFAEMALALVEQHAGDSERALALLQDVGKYWEKNNDNRSRVSTLAAIGTTLVELERHEEARERFEAALALNRDVGDRSAEAQCAIGLARLDHRAARYAEALEGYRRALHILSETIERQTIAMLLQRIAETLAETGRLDEARALLDTSDSIYTAMGCMRPTVLDASHARLRARLEAAGSAGRAQGVNTEYAEVMAFALRVVAEGVRG